MFSFLRSRFYPSWVYSFARYAIKKCGYIGYTLFRRKLSRTISIDESAARAYCLRYHPCAPDVASPSLPPASGGIDLSIIMPVYQAEKYIEKCVRSILDQQCDASFELIAVDDHSPDGSLKILNAIADPRLRVIALPNNMGAGRARNTALEASRGKFLMFVDSDDYLLPGAIQAFMRAAMSDDVDIVQGQYVRFGEDGVLRQVAKLQPGTVVDDLHGMMKYPGFPCMKVFKRSLWEGVGFVEGMAYQDTIVWLLLFPRCRRFKCISDVVYAYRLNDAGISVSVKKGNKALDSYWVAERLFSKQPALGISLTGALYDMALIQYGKYLYTRNENAPEEAQRNMFALAAARVGELRARLGDAYHPRDSVLRALDKAFMAKDFGLWRYLSNLLR